jgi:hypothetical protein
MRYLDLSNSQRQSRMVMAGEAVKKWAVSI